MKLRNAPATFQILINREFYEIINLFCYFTLMIFWSLLVQEKNI